MCRVVARRDGFWRRSVTRNESMRTRMRKQRRAALVGVALSAGAGVAQSNPFYDQPSPQERSELQSWGLRYVFRVDTGTVAFDAGTFEFSNVAMNSPLFNPVVGAARTALSATKEAFEATGCVVGQNLSAANVANSSAAARVRSYLTGSMVGADIIAEHARAAGLADSVVAAVSIGFATTVELNGQNLIASDLPVVAVASSNTSVPQTTAIDPQDIPWIAAVAASAAAIADGFDHLSLARSPIAGGQSPGQAMLAGLAETIENVAVQGGVYAYTVHALFGAYGDLPIVVVTYERGFLLVDAVTGSTRGPYVSGTAIDAESLLVSHPEAYIPGSPVQVVASWSDECLYESPKAGAWNPAPPPGTLTPRPPRGGCPDPVTGPCPHVPSPLPDPGGCTTNPTVGPPPVPGSPRPCFPPANPNLPGWPSTLAYCQQLSDGRCVYRTSGREQVVPPGPPGRPIPTRTTWTCPPGSMNCKDGSYNLPNIGCTPSKEYWY